MTINLEQTPVRNQDNHQRDHLHHDTRDQPRPLPPHRAPALPPPARPARAAARGAPERAAARTRLLFQSRARFARST